MRDLVWVGRRISISHSIAEARWPLRCSGPPCAHERRCSMSIESSSKYIHLIISTCSKRAEEEKSQGGNPQAATLLVNPHLPHLSSRLSCRCTRLEPATASSIPPQHRHIGPPLLGLEVALSALGRSCVSSSAAALRFRQRVSSGASDASERGARRCPGFSTSVGTEESEPWGATPEMGRHAGADLVRAATPWQTLFAGTAAAGSAVFALCCIRTALPRLSGARPFSFCWNARQSSGRLLRRGPAAGAGSLNGGCTGLSGVGAGASLVVGRTAGYALGLSIPFSPIAIWRDF
jgi:hypothetical protein